MSALRSSSPAPARSTGTWSAWASAASGSASGVERSRLGLGRRDRHHPATLNLLPHPQMATPKHRECSLGPTRAWHAARMVRGRRRKREDELAQQDSFRTARRFMYDDVTALGEQLAELHVGTAEADLGHEGRNHCQQAIEHYDKAKHLLSTSTTAEEVIGLEQVVADARWHRAAVLALRAGEPAPQRRAPCFFDAHHGPSTTDAPWTPPAGLTSSPSPCAPQMRVGWPMVRRPRLVWCGSRTDTCRGTRSAVWQGSSGTLKSSGEAASPNDGAPLRPHQPSQLQRRCGQNSPRAARPPVTPTLVMEPAQGAPTR